jgi:hypothetical protein
MTKFVFAALAVTAIISITSIVALRQSPQEHLTLEEVATDWAITETGAAPDWPIAPAHVRMW